MHALALVAAAAVTGCSGNTVFVGEKLDPATSVTIRYIGHPLVFYRNVSGRAAYAKDYVDLGPVEINRSGDYRYYIWLGIWTADGDTSTSATRDRFESVVIFAAGEPLQLEIKGWTPNSIGVSESVYTKPDASAADAYYELTFDQLRQLAEADNLRLQIGEGDSDMFEPWDKQRPGKAALIEFVNGPTY